ncbi:MAG: tetratricopeptide repeat protein, partial [Theionarchaea archaeon]|nr:tetratricopeptide repeat protein [Theionarchaea archaeon]
MKTLIGMILGVLIIGNIWFYPLVATGERFEDSYYVWNFDIDQSGMVHVEVEFHIFAVPFRMTTWELSYDRKWGDKMTNIEAQEKTGEDIKVEMKQYSETVQYSYRFRPKSAGEDIEFTVEYDLEDGLIEIVDEVSYFEFWWTSGENFMHFLTDVYLPAGSEVLFISELEPQEVSGRTKPIVHFEGKTKGMGVRNGIGVAFSEVGKSNLEEGDGAYNAEEYVEARSYYEEALAFYEGINSFYGMGSDEYFGELSEEFDVLIQPTYMGFSSVSAYTQVLENLRDKIEMCQEKAEEKTREADTLFSEGKALFEEKKYEGALETFQKAQELYRSQGESEKAELCQQYSDMCSGFIEEQRKREEANRLLGEGIAYSEQGDCGLAVEKLEQALSLYEELGDEEKAQECTDRIQSCEGQEEEESEDGGFCLGSTFILLGLGLLMFSKKRT